MFYYKRKYYESEEYIKKLEEAKSDLYKNNFDLNVEINELKIKIDSLKKDNDKLSHSLDTMAECLTKRYKKGTYAFYTNGDDEHSAILFKDGKKIDTSNVSDIKLYWDSNDGVKLSMG